jgi:hypothetical protein
VSEHKPGCAICHALKNIHSEEARLAFIGNVSALQCMLQGKPFTSGICMRHGAAALLAIGPAGTFLTGKEPPREIAKTLGVISDLALELADLDEEGQAGSESESTS